MTRIRSKALLSVIAACLAVPQVGAEPLRGSPVATGAIIPVAVFGDDERATLPNRLRNLRNVVGLLFNNESRTVCSAFCVGDDVVATAAHCLFKASATRSHDIDGFRFSRYAADSRSAVPIAGAQSGSAANHVVAGSTQLSTKPPIDATGDWALVRLAQKACVGGHLPLRALNAADLADASAKGRIFQVGFHRDLPGWPLMYSTPCAIARDYPIAKWTATSKEFSRPDDLVLHTCDTGGASSGSPLLMEGSAGPEAVAINVGTYVLTRIVVMADQVIERRKPENVANTAVNVAAFKDALPALQAATVLTASAPLKVLQEKLREQQHYSGRADGRFGPQMRSAITAFERAQGLPATGLPSLEILQRLDPSYHLLTREETRAPVSLRKVSTRNGQRRPAR